MLSLLRVARVALVSSILGASFALAIGACGGGGGAATPDGGDDAGAQEGGHSHHDSASDLPDATCDDAACAKTDVGLPRPIAGVYDDQGVAPRTNAFRALLAFPMRNASDLQAAIAKMYDPSDPTFRKYMTPAAWTAAYGADPNDIAAVRAWIESHGMTVARVGSNNLMLELTGTVGQFDDAFQTELHIFSRANPQTGGQPVDVYGVTGGAYVPPDIAARIASILSCDLPADATPLPGESGAIETTPPPAIADGFTLAQIARAYDVVDLYAKGFKGKGVALGLVVGGTYKQKDVQSFWQSFGVTRADPRTVVTMEPVAHRISETTIDVEWAGGLAPEADLVVYEGADARDTSLLYTFNEAIARGEVQVLSDSFAHREDSEQPAVRRQMDASAMEAAALGITVMAASGDNAKPDLPSASPYVLSVGGTTLTTDAAGNVTGESAWSGSGSGDTSFAMPAWQQGIVPGSAGKRASCDVAVDGDQAYWWYFLGSWTRAWGTSFSSPVMAGILATVNSARIAQGKQPLGYMNALVYTTAAAQGAFRDITSGGTASFQAGPGWDYPTGWGAPKASAIVTAFP
jgi:kumamolisin